MKKYLPAAVIVSLLFLLVVVVANSLAGGHATVRIAGDEVTGPAGLLAASLGVIGGMALGAVAVVLGLVFGALVLAAVGIVLGGGALVLGTLLALMLALCLTPLMLPLLLPLVTLWAIVMLTRKPAGKALAA